MHVNDVCKQLQKQSTKGRKYRGEILRTTFFLIKDRLICFLFKYSLLGHQVWNFFYTFPKNWVGRAMGNETFYLDICFFPRFDG